MYITIKVISITVILLGFFEFVCNEEIKCDVELSVDITDGAINGGNIVKDGISYSEENYFYGNDSRTYGCPCNIIACIRKCCAQGEGLSNKSCEAYSYNSTSYFQQHLTEGVGLDHYYVIHSIASCVDKVRFLLDPEIDNFLIAESGHLIWQNYNFSVNDYCLEYLIEDNTFTALLCSESEPLYHQTIGMIISMPFLLATFLVYALLPDRNLPAKALMCYVLSLLFAYILLVTIQLNNGHEEKTCIALGFFCYFFFMASFFWMNASCLDIFFTFSGIRGLLGDKKKENKRFMYYSAYAWGIPVLMVGFASIFTFKVTDNSNWYTGIGNGQCWFRNGWPTGIYFYFPIAILLIVNIVLFGVTTYKIKKVQRDTKMLKNVDSRKHRKYDNNDKQRYDSDLVFLTDIELKENHSDTINIYDFLEEDSDCLSFNLYVKLLFAMGINWSMEVISWAIMWRLSSVPDYVWVLTDFCNAVYGVFIFFIFVFKRNIWMMLKKRYLQFTGRPQQAHTLTSVNRTTVSQVSNSEA